MATRSVSAILHGAVRVVDPGSDGELVRRFVEERDAGAFRHLVDRHGPMVLAVCRRVTRHRQDAEDAFQAVFLVLARKAGALRHPGHVGGWLHGVATRAAAKVRSTAARRRRRETALVDGPAAPDRDRRCPVLDAEVARLPEKYRTPVVLCELSGVSLKDAAAALGVPLGTVASRLARGRARLAARLRRYSPDAVGLSLAAVVLPVAPAVASAAAALPFGPVPARVLDLSHGVIQDMFLRKLMPMFVGLAALVAGAGVAVTAAAEPLPPADERGTPHPQTVVTVGSPGSGGTRLRGPDAPPVESKAPAPDAAKASDGSDGPGWGLPVKPGKVVTFSIRVLFVKPEGRTIYGYIPDPKLPEGAAPKSEGYRVAGDAAITVDGRDATLKDIPGRKDLADGYAELTTTGLWPDVKLITKVVVTGPTLVGTVARVDGPRVSVEWSASVSDPTAEFPKYKFTKELGEKLSVTEKQFEEIFGSSSDEVTLAQNGRVSVGGKDGKLSDLKAGERVRVTLTCDRSKALSITAGEQPAGDASGPPAPTPKKSPSDKLR